MNPAQKLLQPIMPRPDDAQNEFARGMNMGITLAYQSLEPLTLADFVTLAAVPTVDDFYVNGWVIDNHVPIQFTGDAATARRYVEICIHLETVKRQLLAELAGGV